MIHAYIDAEKAKKELIDLYKERKGIIKISFNYHAVHYNELGAEEEYYLIVKLIRKLNERGAKLICHVYPDAPLYEVRQQLLFANLQDAEIIYNRIPLDSDIIVDQRCGLSQVYDELKSLVEIEL